MDEQEVLQRLQMLISDLAELNFEEWEKLETLTGRAKALVRRNFGETDYFNRLITIKYKPTGVQFLLPGSAKKPSERATWSQGVKQLLALLKEIDEEIELYGLPDPTLTTASPKSIATNDNLGDIMATTKVFISHSHKNRDAAKALVDLLLSGLSLDDADIRCTSVPGHQLPFGKTIAELLKGDINQAPVVIGLISAESQRADWVLFELGAAWGLGRDIFPILGPGIEIRDLPGPLGTLPCVVVEADDASSRMSDLMQQLNKDLGVGFKTGGKVQANLEAFLNCYKMSSEKSLQASGNKSSPANEEEVVLLVIWKLAESEYHQYGYSLETIAQRSNLSIPKCEHVLDTLIKKNFVERKTYHGAITGNRYTLKEAGREQLIQGGRVA
jgi:DNA-binding MarR family transcriptional regulator